MDIKMCSIIYHRPFQSKLAQTERIWYQKISKNCMISVKASFNWTQMKKLKFLKLNKQKCNATCTYRYLVRYSFTCHFHILKKKKPYTTQYLHAFSVLCDWIRYVYTFVFYAHTVHEIDLIITDCISRKQLLCLK